MLAGSSFSTDGQVAGHTTGVSNQADYWIVNADAGGNFLSGKCQGGNANDDAWAIEKTPEGGLIIAGTTASTDAGFTNFGGSDYWLQKFGDCGNVSLPVASSQYFCSSTKPTIANLVATGNNLKWFTGATGGTVFPPATLLHTGTY